MFGSLEGPVKKKEYTEEAAIKSFRTTVFLLRSNPENSAPAGWRLEDDENLTDFGDLVRKPTSLLDAFSTLVVKIPTLLLEFITSRRAAFWHCYCRTRENNL